MLRPAWSPKFGWRTTQKKRSSFTPASLTNLRAWYKSDTGITIGTGVSQWNDLSGNANHLVQATAANQPVVTAGAINGLPAITFDGVNDSLKAGAFTLVQPETIFVVYKQSTWTVDDAICDGNTADSMLLTQQSVTPQIRVYGGTHVGPVSLTLGVFALAAAVLDGASSSLQVNNEAAATGPGGALGGGGFTLGSRATGTNCSDIAVAEVVVMAANATAGERANMRAYVAARYAIAM